MTERVVESDEMIPDKKTAKKLIDLTNRAININEKLLTEEKHFVNALLQNETQDQLQGSVERINYLMRKEVLFNQAAQLLLRKSDPYS